MVTLTGISRLLPVYATVADAPTAAAAPQAVPDRIEAAALSPRPKPPPTGAAAPEAATALPG
ncbi:hypothetical protein [Streptomyces collinus]|uniref:hypothetical protein n=1 Tax=Streptomyces collinus TaxID=42684 RepID=UPI0034084FF9